MEVLVAKEDKKIPKGKFFNKTSSVLDDRRKKLGILNRKRKKASKEKD